MCLPLTKYQASARYLMSSSKLLDWLDKKSLQAFGIDPDQFQTATTYVVVAGPAASEQVLLVENPQSFEACIDAGLDQEMTLVSTYGYGLQWKQVLDNPGAVMGIVRAGQPGQNPSRVTGSSKAVFLGGI